MPIRQDLFTATVNQLLNGHTQNQLSEKLSECVEHARSTGKQAKLSLTLIIKPMGYTGQYQIKDQIKQQLPEMDRGITLMFGTPEGNLTREDPNQQSLDLKSVPEDKPQEYKKAE
jgi:hypothetical protein